MLKNIVPYGHRAYLSLATINMAPHLTQTSKVLQICFTIRPLAAGLFKYVRILVAQVVSNRRNRVKLIRLITKD